MALSESVRIVRSSSGRLSSNAYAMPVNSNANANAMPVQMIHLKWTYDIIICLYSLAMISCTISYTLYHLLDIVGEILENSFFDVSYHQS
jgi:hypothetical protein